MAYGKHLSALLAAALLLPAPASLQAAEEELHLKPKTPWHLDYAESRCRIGRIFGEGEEETVFWLEQHGPGSEFRWLVAGSAIQRFRAWRETRVQFGPVFPAWELEYEKATLDGFGATISGSGPGAPIANAGEAATVSIKPIGLPHLDAVSGGEILWLRLEQKFAQPVVFELERMDKVFEAMNRCVEDLVAHWGVDVETQKTRAVPPRFANIEQVAREIQEYYPSDAVRSGNQANFHLRILVGANGQPTDCTLTNITLAKNFDMRGHPCRVVLDNAMFEPARDVQGNPVASFYETRVMYRIGR